MREILKRLVALKDYKDKVGKDNYYVSEQCEAWAAAREALNGSVLAAVVTFKLRARGACGQTVGADGAGEYAAIFEAKDVETGVQAAHDYIKHLKGAYDVTMVTAEDTYLGSHLMVIRC